MKIKTRAQAKNGRSLSNHLNPLLFNASPVVRMNAAMALGNMPDRTSIPYLMLALRDPDPQYIVPESAYGVLHQLLPKLGPPDDQSYFEAHRQEEVQQLFGWWTDELNGKHSQRNESPDIHPIVAPPVRTLTESDYHLLFSPSKQERQAVISALQKANDRTAIPYLILALQDPDETVSYQSYQTLCCLIGQKQIVDSVSFLHGKSHAVAPLYAWWTDELLTKHIVRVKQQL